MYDHIRQIIETRVFKDNGSDRDLSFSVFLEGREYKICNGSNWAILSIAESNSLRAEFNGSYEQGNMDSGSIRFQLYAPFGDGSRLIREMADELNSFLNYSNGNEGISGIPGFLRLKNGKLSMASQDNDGYLHYNLDYIFDYYT